ncbi:hypothetical protein SAMD00019534_113910 [Acytostelium subglobosum LB1]|uniref:hypothetical protein n=1 Tax=Acytostelium subglobosum LB1 TaxID=1410327 RepID=UPI000645138A|nr:hypothetical protein SAMD00019534_113910 [Acytostelium subglobosum LB1]GAM28215.1 hypothetical protein SAMD00019534_113910 [Acytostelium subglobosum LB1]|eukprot:XP_012748849.1 hypothetical protein SAMD00019534_113910 [Acytostelium subglobosum LB1]
MEHIQSTINDIINEIKDTNRMTNLEKPQSNDHMNNNEVDMSQLVQSIMSCTSVQQFINNNTNALDVNDMTAKMSSSTLSDVDVLSMISRHTDHTREVPYDVDLQVRRIDTDMAKLTDIKRQIEECFKLTIVSSTELGQGPGEFDGCIMSVRLDGCSYLELDGAKWTQMNGAFERQLRGVSTSVVYARGSVYVFGGLDAPTKYTRYALENKKCIHGDITGINGGEGIAACYDGDKLIYLVGGYDETTDRYFNRVDTFNIETQLFQCVGHLPVKHVFMAQAYFHNDHLLVVGSDIGVVSLNPQTEVFSQLVPPPSKPYFASCFDGEDNIYILSHSLFTRYTLSSNKSTSLAKLNATSVSAIAPCYPMHYVESYGIIYLGGRGRNHRYALNEGKWIMLNDNDHVQDRDCFGTCLISKQRRRLGKGKGKGKGKG